MSDQQSNQAIDVQKHVKTYITIFASMIVLVLIGVCTSQMLESTTARVTTVVVFALIQAFLSVSYLMHLNAEKKFIYGVLLLTVLFFFLLILLPLLTTADSTTQHVS
jgi:heme/copper-type cytochrome/quinol oxidase subunit 4